MDTATDLLQHYYDIRAHYYRRRPNRTAHRSTEEIQHIERFMAWCEARQLPPRLFMKKRMEAMWCASHRRSLPRVSQLCSDKLASAWKFVEERHYTEAHCVRMREEKTVDATTVSVRELRADPLPHQERVKANHAGDPAGCASMLRHTGGYHPKSAHCQACSMATHCGTQLNSRHGFDVIALRTGNYNRLPNNILQAALG